MNTIQHAMETETKELERALAEGMRRNLYTEEQAKLYAEQQGLNFINVIVARSELFEVKK